MYSTKERVLYRVDLYQNDSALEWGNYSGRAQASIPVTEKSVADQVYKG